MGNGSFPSLSIGSHPISNAYDSAREVSEDDREHETQNNGWWRFQDCLSSSDLKKDGSIYALSAGRQLRIRVRTTVNGTMMDRGE